MKASKAFDKLVEKYYLAYGANPEYSYFVDQLIETVKKGRILDLGCGVGIPVAKKLANHGYDVVGIDVSKKMVEAAKSNVPNAEFLNEDMLKFKIEPESYDGICAFFSLNHIKKADAPKVIEKVFHGLKEGGAFLVGILEGSHEGKTMLLGEEVNLIQYSEDDLRILLKEFHLILFEKREFAIQGEPVQKQIFAIAKKEPKEHNFADRLLEELTKEEELMEKKKQKPKENPLDAELPLIKITIGKPKKSKNRKKR